MDPRARIKNIFKKGWGWDCSPQSPLGICKYPDISFSELLQTRGWYCYKFCKTKNLLTIWIKTRCNKLTSSQYFDLALSSFANFISLITLRKTLWSRWQKRQVKFVVQPWSRSWIKLGQYLMFSVSLGFQLLILNMRTVWKHCIINFVRVKALNLPWSRIKR